MIALVFWHRSSCSFDYGHDSAVYSSILRFDRNALWCVSIVGDSIVLLRLGRGHCL